MPRDPLLLSELDVMTKSQSATLKKLLIRSEARLVRLTAGGPVPVKENAWCYVRAKSKNDSSSLLPTYIGPVINVARNQRLVITWQNAIGEHDPALTPPILAMPPVANPAHIHMMPDMNASVGVATHLHGARVSSGSDGWPLTPASFSGNPYKFPNSRIYSYPNDQRAAMLWFHDHAMDNTAQQVYAGLAGLYFIRDASDDELFNLIGSECQELPLVIQDRMLTPGMDRLDYETGLAPDPVTKKSMRPEFLGNRIMVNGRIAPVTPVDRKTYRLRLLNGSNARTYALALADFSAATPQWYGHLLTAIGNDGGLYSRPKPLGSNDFLLLAPGERLDVLLDLSSVPGSVGSLRLMNLAVRGLLKPLVSTDPEPIFQTVQKSIMSPSDLSAADMDALKLCQEADVMEFCLTTSPPGATLDQGRLANILASHASDDDFHWNGQELQPHGAVVRNRLIVLMNDTLGLGRTTPPTISPHTSTPWRDTQVWEMKAAIGTGVAPFSLPFNVDLGASAAPGAPASPQNYQVSRFSFFNLPAKVITDNPSTTTPVTYKYAGLFSGSDVIRPKAGTYERWYVGNLGNDPMLGTGTPDMHPFHMHLVNFVVTRRWQIKQGTETFTETTSLDPLDMDKLARHDTVRVKSNELLELLVYFPAGYTGRYPYHCHLLEHEDMGMMLHFDVKP